MLEVKDLKVAYGRVMAVKGISFKVDQGQVVTLLGTNGAGKTTTLRTISGLIRPEAGEIWFEGSRIDTTPAHEVADPRPGAFAGGAPDLPAPYRRGEPPARRLRAQRSGWDSAGFGASLQSLRHSARETLATRWHVLWWRAADAGHWPSHDEPAEAVDARRAVNGAVATDDAARSCQPSSNLQSEGVTILLVEQNAQAALSLANYGYVLEVGKIVLENTGEALLVDENVRKVYLGED